MRLSPSAMTRPANSARDCLDCRGGTIMRALRWAAISGMATGLALCAGCFSKPSHKPAAGDTALGALAWSEMTGLTQDQIRVRLGLKSTGETFATQGVRM